MVNLVRKAIERLYNGTCTVTVREAVTDQETHITAFDEVVLCYDEPCRLSYSSSNQSTQSNTVADVTQIIKLFLRPELEVPAGSSIDVTQNGRTVRYTASGAPSVHANHQEIVLTIKENKA